MDFSDLHPVVQCTIVLCVTVGLIFLVRMWRDF
jgi:hypothetical protein